MLVSATTFGLLQYCTQGNECLVAAAVGFNLPEISYTFEQDLFVAQSTTAHIEGHTSLIEYIFSVIKILGIYLVLIGVVVLIFLELLELRYVRALLKTRHT